jgi:hypothetical protein
VSEARVVPLIVHTRLESPNLAGNLLGDPSERDLFVYLPPGYEKFDRRYPTAYPAPCLRRDGSGHGDLIARIHVLQSEEASR